ARCIVVALSRGRSVPPFPAISSLPPGMPLPARSGRLPVPRGFVRFRESSSGTPYRSLHGALTLLAEFALPPHLCLGTGPSSRALILSRNAVRRRAAPISSATDRVALLKTASSIGSNEFKLTPRSRYSNSHPPRRGIQAAQPLLRCTRARLPAPQSSCPVKA